jgi:hypothetical protein
MVPRADCRNFRYTVPTKAYRSTGSGQLGKNQARGVVELTTVLTCVGVGMAYIPQHGPRNARH